MVNPKSDGPVPSLGILREENHYLVFFLLNILTERRIQNKHFLFIHVNII